MSHPTTEDSEQQKSPQTESSDIEYWWTNWFFNFHFDVHGRWTDTEDSADIPSLRSPPGQLINMEQKETIWKFWQNIWDRLRLQIGSISWIPTYTEKQGTCVLWQENVQENTAEDNFLQYLILDK